MTEQSDEDLLRFIERDPLGGIGALIDRYGAKLRGRLLGHAVQKQYGNAEVDDVWIKAIARLLDPDCRAELRADGGLVLPWLSKWGYWRLDDAARRRPGALPEGAAAASAATVFLVTPDRQYHIIAAPVNFQPAKFTALLPALIEEGDWAPTVTESRTGSATAALAGASARKTRTTVRNSCFFIFSFSFQFIVELSGGEPRL